MQFYILNSDYEIIGMVDEADSALSIKKYNDVGECTIRVSCNAEYVQLLRTGNYIFRFDDDMICKIETPEIETDAEQGDYYTVTAYDFIKVFSGRIVWNNFTYSGTFGGFWRKVLNENVINSPQPARNIANLVLDLESLDSITDEITYSTKSDDILQLLITTCKTYGVGFRLSFDINAHQFIFRLYRGKNKALTTSEVYIEFSPTFANMLSSHYKEDESNYKNVAVVGAKATDESLLYITVYEGDQEPQGLDRKEMYIDATSQSRNITVEDLTTMFPNVVKSTPIPDTEDEKKVKYNYTSLINGVNITVATSEAKKDVETGEISDEKITVTDYTFRKMLEIIGYNGLAEHRMTQEFTGEVDTIDTYEYKGDYDLGDIVKVENEYGITAEAQISEIWESEDSDSPYTVEPKFEYFS